jgi:hypothetical protein
LATTLGALVCIQILGEIMMFLTKD